MKRGWLLALAAFIAAAWLPAADVRLDVKEHVLANGLKILMLENHDAPRVVCHVYYKVGSINERPGITGIAHLHEHMMFKGTRMMGVTDYDRDDAINQKIDALMMQIYREKYWKQDGDTAKIAPWQKEVDALVKDEKPLIIKDDLWEIYMRNGGTGLNASTSQEVTGYYVTLPANKVELQMLLEADRMKNAYFREFYSEKDVVMEERRLSENSPGFLFDEQLTAAFYTASPYHWEVLGWMDDLKRITRTDMEEFHNRYYVPSNAVAVYVGDLKPDEIIRLAETHFGPLPRGPEVEPIRTAEPAQQCEKRLSGEGMAAPKLTMMFHIPPAGHPDTYPLLLLGEILSGETGRFYKSLVKEKDMATQVSARTQPQWYVGALEISGSPKVAAGFQPESLEPEVWKEIEKIQKEGVTELELQKAKNKSEARFVMGLQSFMLPMRLGRAELNRGWRSLFTDMDQMKQVSLADIQRVAARYLVHDNATIGIYKRKAQQ